MSSASEKADALKREGNALFASSQWAAARAKYSQMLVAASRIRSAAAGKQGKAKVLVVGYANRAATSLALSRWADVLRDTDRAMALLEGDEADATMAAKVLRRRATALEKLGRLGEATLCLQGILDKDVRQEGWEAQVRADLARLQLENQGKEDAVQREPEKEQGSQQPAEEPVAIALDYDPKNKSGRFLSSTGLAPIAAGTLVLVDEPYDFVCTNLGYCHDCLGRTGAPLPCERCGLAWYCSDECQERSKARVHAIECEHAEAVHLWTAEQLLATRLLRKTTRSVPPHLFELLGNKGGDGVPGIVAGRLQENASLFALESHVDQVEISQYSHFLAWATKAIELVFPENDIVSAVLAEMVFRIRRNAFAITDSASIHDTNDDKRQIALAVYPAASLFNHSCTPNCIVSFDGPRIFVRTTEAVSARSPLLISYGPTATRTPDRSARQKLLQLQYCFTCGCPSCSSTQDTRTPIDAWLCPCSAAVPPRSTQCPVCQSPLDVPAIERDLQDADTAFATARSHLDKQEPHPQSVPQLKRALELRLRRLHRFNRTLGYTWDSLAQALALNGDFKGATGMLERSIAVVTNAFGPDSIELANELLKYAEIALQSNQPQKAKPALNKANELFKRFYGTNHPSFIEVVQLQRMIGDQ